jgi:MFS family permease
MLLILFLTAFNLFLGFSLIFPIFPSFVKELNGSPSDVGLLVSIQPLMQFLFSPIWGKLSDKYGRKKFIFLGMLGYAISFYFTAIANSIEFLYFARIFGGIISSSAIPTILAYASSISSNNKRNVSLGIIGAGFGLGLVIGPFIGGLVGHFDIRTVFFVSFYIFLLNALLVQLFLKEVKVQTLHSKKLKFNLLNSYVLFASIVYLVILLCATAMQIILGMLLTYKFHLDILNIGMILGIGGVFGVISQFSIGPLLKKFSEKSLIVFSVLLLGITIFIVGFVDNVEFLYLLTALYGISFGISQPNLTARVSKKIPDEYQGEFMGIFQAFGSIGRFLGPILCSLLYQFHPSLPYLISGIILIIFSLLCLLWI